MTEKGTSKPLWEGHRQRLRSRLEREGWGALRPHEAVEVALCHAVPRQDLSDVARALVDRFGSVGGVFAASRVQLEDVPGMTPSLARWVGLTGELIRAYYDLHAETDLRLEFCREVTAFVRSRADRARPASLWALYADFDFNLITYAELGGAPDWWDGANVRRLMAEAIGCGAKYVYLVRWPQGPLEADDGDYARLEAIAETLRAADILLVDCLLAGKERVVSLRQRGWMPQGDGDSLQMALHENYTGN